nr:hybrid sensor histidine kinase/response regulator [Pontibacter vulgaris]
MIIDDDLVDQMAIRRSLKKSIPHAVIYTSKTAEQGLELLKQHIFDCIFIDFKLPDMDGLALMEAIRNTGVDIPVLIVTSHGDERIAAQAILKGAADYIPKGLLTPEGIYHSLLNAIRLHKTEQQRRKAEEQLRATQHQLEFVINNSPMIFINTDSEGIITFLKGKINKVLPVDEKAIVGRSLIEEFKAYPRIVARYKRALAGETVQSTDESNGYFFKAHYIPVFDQQQQVTGVTCFVIDITESFKNERELIHAKELAEKSVRVKEQFIANISHEIRTPMNGIIGLANVLSKTALSENQHKYLKAIRSSADNLMVIINDLLDFSKISAEKFTIEEVDFNLFELIQETVDLLEVKAIERNNTLSTFIDSKVPEKITGDPTRLKQVLLNLISNAAKFTENGQIKLLVNVNSDKDAEVILEFTVEDTGIGIPEDKLQAIFESFNQASNDTSRKYGGTGLGLTISKSLIEMQGGSITVRSKPMSGSAFTFSLPFRKQQEPVAPAHQLNNEQATLISPLSGLRILLAEDNEINQLLINAVVSGWDIAIDTVENGAKALENLDKYTYDLILMDMQMPEVDGYEAIQRIRESDTAIATIPIIALTAHAIPEEINRCLAAGADAYVAKPFEPETLYSTIAKLTRLAGIDASINIKALHGMASGNREFMADILQMYLATIPENVQRLNMLAAGSNDTESFKACLLELLDTVSVISAQPLQTTLEQMQDNLESGKIQELQQLIQEVTLQSQETTKLLEQELAIIQVKN